MLEIEVNFIYYKTVVLCLNGKQCTNKAIYNLNIQIMNALLKCSEECVVFSKNSEPTTKVMRFADLTDKKKSNASSV